MQIDRMRQHLLDTAGVKGDYIEFRIHKATVFSQLASQADAFQRTAYGISTLEGLGAPSGFDRTSNNTVVYGQGRFSTNKAIVDNTMRRQAKGTSYEILYGAIPNVLTELPETTYAFAVMDLIQYAPTKLSLNYVWERMSYGGTLYFGNFIQNDNSAATRAVKEFINAHEDEIIVSKQMMVNGVREKELAIKCLRKELKPLNWRKDELLQRPVTIALVLKTGGGVYDYKYVNNLVEGVKSNLNVDHQIVCLTDDPKGLSSDIDRIERFKHDLPKWWGKIELFRPGLFEGEQVFYFDLDTFIVDSLDEIVFYNGEFCALRDFYHLHTMGSGVMSWHGERVVRIYDEFMANPQRAMSQFAAEGDQAWINKYRPAMDYFQDVFPNEVVSYKAHCVKPNNQVQLPKKAKVVCFHGKPRPHEVRDNFRQYWKQ